MVANASVQNLLDELNSYVDNPPLRGSAGQQRFNALIEEFAQMSIKTKTAVRPVQPGLREAVGVFHQVKDLQAAIDDLLSTPSRRSSAVSRSAIATLRMTSRSHAASTSPRRPSARLRADWSADSPTWAAWPPRGLSRWPAGPSQRSSWPRSWPARPEGFSEPDWQKWSATGAPPTFRSNWTAADCCSGSAPGTRPTNSGPSKSSRATRAATCMSILFPNGQPRRRGSRSSDVERGSSR
jgi:hypothetical protein